MYHGFSPFPSCSIFDCHTITANNSAPEDPLKLPFGTYLRLTIFYYISDRHPDWLS